MSFFTPRRFGGPRSTEPSEGLQAARAARLSAEASLHSVRRDADEVRITVSSLETTRTNNHFGDAVYIAMQPRK